MKDAQLRTYMINIISQATTIQKSQNKKTLVADILGGGKRSLVSALTFLGIYRDE